MLFRVVMIFVYVVVALYAAFPLSYWFQGCIYNEMTWGEYLGGGVDSLRIAAQFGAGEVYRYTVIGSVIGMLIVGYLLERFIAKKRNK